MKDIDVNEKRSQTCKNLKLSIIVNKYFIEVNVIFFFFVFRRKEYFFSFFRIVDSFSYKMEIKGIMMKNINAILTFQTLKYKRFCTVELHSLFTEGWKIYLFFFWVIQNGAL